MQMDVPMSTTISPRHRTMMPSSSYPSHAVEKWLQPRIFARPISSFSQVSTKFFRSIVEKRLAIRKLEREKRRKRRR